MLEAILASSLMLSLAGTGILGLHHALDVAGREQAQGRLEMAGRRALGRLAHDLRGSAGGAASARLRIIAAPGQDDASPATGGIVAEGPCLVLQYVSGYDRTAAEADVIRPAWSTAVRYRVAGGKLIREEDREPLDGRFTGPGEREVLALGVESVWFRSSAEGLCATVRLEATGAHGEDLPATVSASVLPFNSE